MKKTIAVLLTMIVILLCLIAILLIRREDKERASSVMQGDYPMLIIDEELPEHGLDLEEKDGVIIFPPNGIGTTTANGSGGAAPVKPDSTAPGQDQSILGNWFYWSRRPDSFDFYIFMVTYCNDGTCWREVGFYWPPDGRLETQSGSYEVAEGEYSFDGSVLIEDGVKSTVKISGNKMTVTNNGGKAEYTRGSYDQAIRQIVAEYFDKEIVGDWYYVDDREASSGEYTIWEIQFSEDRKCWEKCYTYSVATDIWTSYHNPETNVYFFDGETLYSGNDKTAACIRDGVLQVKEPYGNEYMYLTKGNVEDAVEAIRKKLGDQGGTPPEAEAPANDPAILGLWQDASVDLETYHYFDAGYWEFYSDGTFQCESREGGAWIYSKEDGLVYDNSYPGGGGQMSRGTYTFDGSTLTLTYTWIEWVDAADLPYTVSHQISINGNTISWGTNTLYKGERLEVANRLFAQ